MKNKQNEANKILFGYTEMYMVECRNKGIDYTTCRQAIATLGLSVLFQNFDKTHTLEASLQEVKKMVEAFAEQLYETRLEIQKRSSENKD